MEIKISKIKVRRGTNNQRKHIVLDQGELAYTTDTKRLFVGSGVLSGGDPAATVFHLPVTSYNSLTSIPAVRNDVVNANSKTYQLTGTDASDISQWADISLKIASPFAYSADNTLTMTISALSASIINPATVSNGIKIEDNILQTSFITKSLEISANKLSIKANSIDEREIASSSFLNGLSGGNGEKISLKVDPQYFYFSSGVLSLSSIPVSSNVTALTADNSTLYIDNGLIYVLPSGITETEINNSSFGNGLSGGNGEKITLHVDDSVFSFDVLGRLTYNNVFNLSSFDPYGIDATFVGKASGLASLSADESVFVGLSSGFNSPHAENSVFVGGSAGYNLGNNLEPTTTMNSVFVGSYAGFEASTSVFSNFVGSNAGSNSTNSSYCNFIGGFAGADSLSASKSNFVGFEAGNSASGTNINAIGYQAGKESTGDNNIFLGSNTSTLSGNISGCLVVGVSAVAVEDNTIVLGATNFPFLTAAVGVSTGLSLVLRLNGTDFTIPLHTRI